LTHGAERLRLSHTRGISTTAIPRSSSARAQGQNCVPDGSNWIAANSSYSSKSFRPRSCWRGYGFRLRERLPFGLCDEAITPAGKAKVAVRLQARFAGATPQKRRRHSRPSSSISCRYDGFCAATPCRGWDRVKAVYFDKKARALPIRKEDHSPDIAFRAISSPGKRVYNLL
jgi:hypothetical protein